MTPGSKCILGGPFKTSFFSEWKCGAYRSASYKNFYARRVALTPTMVSTVSPAWATPLAPSLVQPLQKEGMSVDISSPFGDDLWHCRWIRTPPQGECCDYYVFILRHWLRETQGEIRSTPTNPSDLPQGWGMTAPMPNRGWGSLLNNKYPYRTYQSNGHYSSCTAHHGRMMVWITQKGWC